MTQEQKLQQPFVISLTIHALLALFVILFGVYQESIRSRIVDVEWIESDDSRNKAIVKSDSGEVIERADKNAFLGEKNRHVSKQTVSKNPSVEKTRAQKPSLAKLGVPFLSTKPMDSEGLKPAERFKENYSQFNKEVQASKPAGGDFVKGLEESTETALNTKEFVFFGYFQRIRSQLDQAWQPILRKQIEGMFRRGRRLASEMEYLTKTVVVLNNKGEVIQVKVLEESGTRALDDAAVKAFNQAGPFPNPPGGLADSNGNISIRWDFLLRT